MFWWVPTASANTFMPPAATKIAAEVNHLYGFMLIASVISFIILMGAFIFFVVKYKRRSAKDSTPYITHNHTLEFVWSFIPFVIFMVCFAWGAHIYLKMRTFDEGAMEVHVFGKKWAWEFEYKNGRRVTAEVNAEGQQVPATMVVPLGVPVKLIMTSVKLSPQDKAVLHSFFIPAFRVKQDVVPGRYSALSFTAEQKGMFQIFCTEYCGTGHSTMLARVHVVSQEEFDAWIMGDGAAGSGELSMADKGRQAYAKYACIGCHSLGGQVMTGPTWKGLWGSKREFNDGGSAVADENYLRESIWEPNKHIVKGYEPNKMPTFKGLINDEELTALIEYIKTIK
ncbi:MAG: cytochrome c oxidase subunit II [Bdellovibrionales bacterium]|nr:cytochrome c oxidase subunit II [Bdellovibrionales bacterium]